MNYEDVKKIVEMRKGTIHTVSFGKELKTRKGIDCKVNKETIMQARFGVQYDNISDVKQQRENGELPKENAGLPWGQWELYPYFIAHKGNHYARLSLVNGSYPKTVYKVDGVVTDKAKVQELCLKSEFSENNKPLEVVTVKIDNITEIK